MGIDDGHGDRYNIDTKFHQYGSGSSTISNYSPKGEMEFDSYIRKDRELVHEKLKVKIKSDFIDELFNKPVVIVDDTE
jgi:hypothetical protein